MDRKDTHLIYLIIKQLTMAIFPSDYTEKTSPVTNDYMLLADSADSNKIKKIKFSAAKGDP